MQVKTSKAYIKQELFGLAMVTRMGIEDGEFTEEEAKELIAKHGGEAFDKVLSMTNDEFMLLKLKELAKLLEERRKSR